MLSRQNEHRLLSRSREMTEQRLELDAAKCKACSNIFQIVFHFSPLLFTCSSYLGFQLSSFMFQCTQVSHLRCSSAWLCCSIPQHGKSSLGCPAGSRSDIEELLPVCGCRSPRRGVLAPPQPGQAETHGWRGSLLGAGTSRPPQYLLPAPPLPAGPDE